MNSYIRKTIKSLIISLIQELLKIDRDKKQVINPNYKTCSSIDLKDK